jgi:hypothetical protein
MQKRFEGELRTNPELVRLEEPLVYSIQTSYPDPDPMV